MRRVKRRYWIQEGREDEDGSQRYEAQVQKMFESFNLIAIICEEVFFHGCNTIRPGNFYLLLNVFVLAE